MIVSIVIIVFFSLLVFGLSLFVHELGHLAYFRYKLNKKVRLFIKKGSLVIGEDVDYFDLKDSEFLDLLIWGVLSGFVVIIFAGILFGDYMYFLLLPYWACNKSDIANVIKEFKKLEVKDGF